MSHPSSTSTNILLFAGKSLQHTQLASDERGLNVPFGHQVEVLQFEGIQPTLETRSANVFQLSLQQKFSQKVTTDSSTR